MAVVLTPMITDDLDPRIATHAPTKHTVTTRRFHLDGADYEIDLSPKNGAELDRIMAQYIPHARKAGTAKTSTRARTSTRRAMGVANGHPIAGPVDPKAVRAWCVEQGIRVNSKGRIAAEALDMYHAAH